MKANPPAYCPWCEEKLATKQWFPYCSQHDAKAAVAAGWAGVKR